MIPKDRIVLDTTVYFAAAYSPHGYSVKILEATDAGRYEIFVSSKILDEIEAKLLSKARFSAEQCDTFLRRVLDYATLTYPTVEVEAPTLRDQRDLHILECAVATKANLIITSDKDLLDLKSYNEVKIAHPSMMKFWYKS